MVDMIDCFQVTNYYEIVPKFLKLNTNPELKETLLNLSTKEGWL